MSERGLLLVARKIWFVSKCKVFSGSTIGGGRGCHKFVPVLGGDGTVIAPTEDLFNNPLVK